MVTQDREQHESTVDNIAGQAPASEEKITKQEESTATSSPPPSAELNKATEDITTEQGRPESENQKSQAPAALKLETTSDKQPTSPRAPSSDAAASLPPPTLSPRPQSFAAEGSATLPIRGPLRPLSTVIGDTPSEQFDSLYDTLPTDFRAKKLKPKVRNFDCECFGIRVIV